MTALGRLDDLEKFNKMHSVYIVNCQLILLCPLLTYSTLASGDMIGVTLACANFTNVTLPMADKKNIILACADMNDAPWPVLM